MTMLAGRAYSMSSCCKTLGMSRQSQGSLGGVVVVAGAMQCVATIGQQVGLPVMKWRSGVRRSEIAYLWGVKD